MHTLTANVHVSPAVRLLRIGPWSAPQGLDFPRHRHPCWEVHYYRAGSIDAVIDGTTHVARPGVVTVVPPGVWHGEIALTAYDNFWVHVDAPAEHPWPRMVVDDENASIGHTIRSMLREHQDQAVGKAIMQDLLVAQLDIQLQRASAQVSRSRVEQLVREAEWTMHERISQPVSIEEIAALVGVSTSRLRAAFAERRGASPRTVLRRIRAEHAVHLIQSTSASSVSLEAVAYSCGYDSASHLSRHIRRHTGMSPGRLRAASR